MDLQPPLLTSCPSTARPDREAQPQTPTATPSVRNRPQVPTSRPGRQTINESQQAALDQLLASDANLFICGQAGTGKSYVLSAFIEQSDKEVVVCAPTGLAATHVDGVTIHSLFRLPIDTDFLDYSPTPHEETDKVLARVDTVVIDEASMVRADMLDAIDARLRLAREDSSPFGGAQLILFGDLLQLPPIVVRENEQRLRERYASEFFFDSDVAQNTNFTTIELTRIMRQQERDFARSLAYARVGRAGDAELALINSRVAPNGETTETIDLPKPILATRNDVVKRHNDDGLDALPGKPFAYVREWRGRDGHAAPKDAPCEHRIVLKVGCPVLFTRNDPELGVSNGTAGVVKELDPDFAVIDVAGEEIEVEQQPFAIKEYVFDEAIGAVALVERGEFLQLPLRLGFAMTIHRAQGQTYDAATVDLASGNPFVDGHTYVAVSRVRTLEGLTLTRALRPGDFRCSARARSFLAATAATAAADADRLG